MTDGYMHGARVKADILRHGLRLWAEGGAQAVSARAIGRAMGLTHAGVLYHFSNSAKALKDGIADEAVRTGERAVIRHLIVSDHEAVAGMSPATRQEWLAGA